MNVYILITLLSTNSVLLSWDTTPGTHYRLLSASSQRQPVTWTTVTNIPGTGDPVQVAQANTSSERYFSIVAKTNVLANKKLYIETNTPAARQAELWKTSRPQDAELMKKIRDQPTSVWITSSDTSRIGHTFAKCGTHVSDIHPVLYLSA
jgi:hypothetical protein